MENKEILEKKEIEPIEEKSLLEDTKPGKIYTQIAKIMEEISPVSKKGVNEKQGWIYRKFDDLYNELCRLQGKHKVICVPRILKRERWERKSSNGALKLHTILHCKFTYYAEDGSYVVNYADGEAMDVGDKVTNKCMTIAHKYSLQMMYCVPFEDNDPDKDSHTDIVPTDMKLNGYNAQKKTVPTTPPKKTLKAEIGEMSEFLKKEGFDLNTLMKLLKIKSIKLDNLSNVKKVIWDYVKKEKKKKEIDARLAGEKEKATQKEQVKNAVKEETKSSKVETKKTEIEPATEEYNGTTDIFPEEPSL